MCAGNRLRCSNIITKIDYLSNYYLIIVKLELLVLEPGGWGGVVGSGNVQGVICRTFHNSKQKKGTSRFCPENRSALFFLSHVWRNREPCRELPKSPALAGGKFIKPLLSLNSGDHIAAFPSFSPFKKQ